MLTLFLFQKGQGFFPPLPIAALAPVLGAGHTYTLRLEMLQCGLNFFAAQKASKLTRQLQRGSELAIPRGQKTARGTAWAVGESSSPSTGDERHDQPGSAGAVGNWMCVFEIYAYAYFFSKKRPLSVRFLDCTRFNGQKNKSLS